MKYWKKLTHKQQDARITEALNANEDFSNNICLGIPASKLDEQVFYEQAPFLKEAPLLRAFVQNPNHIGCHTFGESEPFFKGTHELEREVIELLSVDFFKASPHTCDGYIASGGTEANIQAAWIYRNYFRAEHNAGQHEIAILCSVDTHYSVVKAANLLNLSLYTVEVDEVTRTVKPQDLDSVIYKGMEAGVRFFIVFCNMGTTMFGSVDSPTVYAKALQTHSAHYRIHVDGAFGGFIFPISCPENGLNFANPEISSITLDAHKMLQAPYGTGIFLARKGLMRYVCTQEAGYVAGTDMTLIGSRGGMNAIAIWMILFTYGPYGWLEKINKLLYRTDWLCQKLDELDITYYRHPGMNIVTIRAIDIPKAVARKYRLVPDNHTAMPCWYKIVLMDHVSIDHLQHFVGELKEGVAV